MTEAMEIEKKFLIREDGQDFVTAAFYRSFGSIKKLHQTTLEHGISIRQGYLPKGDSIVASLDIPVSFLADEVRLRQAGDLYFVTAKSRGGLERIEFETEVSKSEFEELWPLTEGKRVRKMRWNSVLWNLTYEFDIYTDERDLLVCEVELPNIKSIEKVEPIGKDVTKDEKYKNKNLAR